MAMEESSYRKVCPLFFVVVLFCCLAPLGIPRVQFLEWVDHGMILGFQGTKKYSIFICIYDTSQKWLTEKSAKFWHWTAKDLKFTKVTTGKGTWKKSVEHLSQGNDYITYNCQSLSIPNAWLKLQKQLSPGRPGKKGDPFQKMPSRLQADLSHCYAQMKWFDDEQIPSKGTSIISPTIRRHGWEWMGFPEHFPG